MKYLEENNFRCGCSDLFDWSDDKEFLLLAPANGFCREDVPKLAVKDVETREVKLYVMFEDRWLFVANLSAHIPVKNKLAEFLFVKNIPLIYSDKLIV